MTFPTNLPDSITMNLDTITVGDKVLTFDYSVRSYCPCQVFLLTNLYHQDHPEGIRIDPDLLYVYQRSGAPLSLCKQLLQAPDGTARNRLEIPLASLLEPGWTMTETVRLPLPIQVNHPYVDSNVQETVSTDRFTFTIGYLLAEEDIELHETVTVGDSEYRRFDYDYLLVHQRLKKSPLVKANLTRSEVLEGSIEAVAEQETNE